MESERSPPITLLSSPELGTTSRASSVLQRNVKLYGPMNVLDLNNSSSCWNSEGGGAVGAGKAWILLEFGRWVLPTEIRMQLQAGFTAEVCQVQLLLGPEDGEKEATATTAPDWQEWTRLEVADTHEIQSFPLAGDDGGSCTSCRTMRFLFDNFTDFYGRITIYRIEVWGQEKNCP